MVETRIIGSMSLNHSRSSTYRRGKSVHTTGTGSLPTSRTSSLRFTYWRLIARVGADAMRIRYDAQAGLGLLAVVVLTIIFFTLPAEIHPSSDRTTTEVRTQVPQNIAANGAAFERPRQELHRYQPLVAFCLSVICPKATLIACPAQRQLPKKQSVCLK